jgi:HSP20 family protein
MAQNSPNRGRQGGNLTTRNQFHPLDLFRREFDRIFDRFLGWPAASEQDAGEMRIWDFRVTETDNEIVVRAEMPGFEENELNIQVNDNILTVQAEKEQKGQGMEHYRSYYRSMTLPGGIDPEKIQASYHNGVLEMHIPRPESSRPRRIAVQGQKGGTAQPQIKGQSAQTAETQRAETPTSGGKEHGKKSATPTAKA